MSGPIVTTRHARVAHLQLTRPHVLNAIDTATCDALDAELDALEASSDVGALVISGAGDRAFCAGADLGHMRALAGAALRRFIELTWKVNERLAASPLPSIAALHGHVLGGGLELALACDLRIADESVQIGLPEMALGSVPGSGALQRLPALIGPARAAELIMIGHRVGAAEAVSLGLVNRVVERGEALAAALAWAEIVAGRPPEALRYAKLALRVGRQPEIAAALHGLVSDACHAAKGYRDNTEQFRT